MQSSRLRRKPPATRSVKIRSGDYWKKEPLMRTLRIDSMSPYQRVIGVGGVGTGVFFKLAGDHTLGRNESRAGELLDVRDYCKLHIVLHYVAKLLGAGKHAWGFEILPLAKIGNDAPGRFVLHEMQM